MDEGVKTLMEMADFDARIFSLRKRLRKFPVRLEDSRRQLNAEEALLGELQTPWDELEYKISEKEATIQVALETIEKFEEHIKRVTTQKEYMAAKKQVEEARKLNTQLQDEILENRVKQEELAPQLKDVRERYTNVLEAFEEEEKKILKEQGDLESEMEAQETQLKALAEKLGGNLWTYYQRLVKGGKSPAIVQAVSGTCTGCNMAVPPQSYNMMIADPNRTHTCAHCARIIYYRPPDPEAPEEGSAASDAAPAEKNASEPAVPENAPAVEAPPGA